MIHLVSFLFSFYLLTFFWKSIWISVVVELDDNDDDDDDDENDVW